jgi:hypothetical protein
MTATSATAPTATATRGADRHRYNGSHPVHSDAPTPIRAHCSCGWQSEPVINAEFAYQQWEKHRAVAEDPNEADRYTRPCGKERAVAVPPASQQ